MLIAYFISKSKFLKWIDSIGYNISLFELIVYSYTNYFRKVIVYPWIEFLILKTQISNEEINGKIKRNYKMSFFIEQTCFITNLHRLDIWANKSFHWIYQYSLTKPFHWLKYIDFSASQKHKSISPDHIFLLFLRIEFVCDAYSFFFYSNSVWCIRVSVSPHPFQKQNKIKSIKNQLNIRAH